MEPEQMPVLYHMNSSQHDPFFLPPASVRKSSRPPSSSSSSSSKKASTPLEPIVEPVKPSTPSSASSATKKFTFSFSSPSNKSSASPLAPQSPTSPPTEPSQPIIQSTPSVTVLKREPPAASLASPPPAAASSSSLPSPPAPAPASSAFPSPSKVPKPKPFPVSEPQPSRPSSTRVPPLPKLPDGQETVIFWDIDNLKIPAEFQAQSVHKVLVDTLEPALVQCFGDPRILEWNHLIELNQCNVDVFAIPSGGIAKELADNRMISKMNRYIVDVASRGAKKGRIVVMSSDKDFSPHLHNARGLGFEIVLIHTVMTNCNPALRSSAHHLIVWEDILYQAYGVSKQMDNDFEQKKSISAPASASSYSSQSPFSRTPPKKKQSPSRSPPVTILKKGNT